MKEFKLDNQPKIKSGFTTPEHYFEQFSEKMMQHLEEETPQKAKVIPLFKNNKNVFYAVAAVLVIALCIPIVQKFKAQNDQQEVAILEEYITNETEITTEDIAGSLEKSDLDNMKVDFKLEKKKKEDELSKNKDLEPFSVE